MGIDFGTEVNADLAGSPALWKQARMKVHHLTRRELEVLNLMAEGMSGQEIGSALGISKRTVDIFRGKVFRKLEVKSGISAVRLAIYAALAGADPSCFSGSREA